MDFVYQDQENIVSNFRKLRSHSNNNRKSENQVMKRSVLGVINVDTNKIAPAKLKNVRITLGVPVTRILPLIICRNSAGSTEKCSFQSKHVQKCQYVSNFRG